MRFITRIVVELLDNPQSRGLAETMGMRRRRVAQVTFCEMQGLTNLTCAIMSKSRFALADVHAFDLAVCDGKDMQQRLI